jgi:hypothetical protein
VHVCAHSSRRASRVTEYCKLLGPGLFAHTFLQTGLALAQLFMDTDSTGGPGPTTIGRQPEPEPKPIRRLQDEVINRIAAGEVSPPFPLPACHPVNVRALALMPSRYSFLVLRSYIARLLPSRNCLKTVWMRALLLFVSPLGTGV